MDPVTNVAMAWSSRLIGGLLVTILFLCTILFGYGQYRKAQRLELAQKGTSAAVVATKVKAQGVATYIKEKREVDVRTDEVLDSAPEYSDGSVPADVADLLRDNGSAR